MGETYFQKIGKRVKELRKRKGLSQEELARKADISTTYVSKIESGNCNPSFRIMSKMSHALADKGFWIEEEREGEG